MHWVLVVNVPLPIEVLSTPFAPWPSPSETLIKRQVTQHDCLPSLLSDGDQRIEICSPTAPWPYALALATAVSYSVSSLNLLKYCLPHWSLALALDNII
jgi:hypothetical protein